VDASLLLLFLSALLAAFNLKKDWSAHKNIVAKMAMVVLILCALVAGIINNLHSSHQRAEDQKQIRSLSYNISGLINQLTSANTKLESSDRHADDLRRQLDAQQKQNIGNAVKLTSQLNRSLGSLIPLNGFRLHVNMIGIRRSVRQVFEDVPESETAINLDFPAALSLHDDATTPSAPGESGTATKLAPVHGSSPLVTPGTKEDPRNTLSLTINPYVPAPDLPRHFLCFDESGDIQQVGMSVHLSDQPAYRLLVVGDPQKKNEEAECVITTVLGARDDALHSEERKIRIDDIGIENRSSAHDSVALTAYVSKGTLEQQRLTHFLTMSSFEGTASVLIRLTVSKRHSLSAKTLNRLANDFLREAPKSFLLEMETGIPGQELRTKRYLTLTALRHEEVQSFDYFYLSYSDAHSMKAAKGYSAP
jgi:hypothetical protein